MRLRPNGKGETQDFIKVEMPNRDIDAHFCFRSLHVLQIFISEKARAPTRDETPKTSWRRSIVQLAFQARDRKAVRVKFPQIQTAQERRRAPTPSPDPVSELLSLSSCFEGPRGERVVWSSDLSHTYTFPQIEHPRFISNAR